MPNKGKPDVIWELLLEADNVVLTTHVRPDGDGIASELALGRVLKSLNKNVHIYNQDRTPDVYTWLPGSDEIRSAEEEHPFPREDIDLAVLMDCSSSDRIGTVFEHIRDAKRIVSVDHHDDSDCFRHGCYVDTKASSIGELLFSLIPDIANYLDKEIATCIYVSIMTDTGSFAYSNTTKRVFEIVSTLMNYGVEPNYAHRMVYSQKSIRHFRLLGKALERMKIDETGQIVHVDLPSAVYRQTGAHEEDNEGIIEVIRGLKNCRLIILLRQLEGNRLKGSLRSTGVINCVHLAKLFGGGGHLRASGFVLDGEVTERGPAIVERIKKEVMEKGWL
jgi:phosphoesterase RecJ-like protein